MNRTLRALVPALLVAPACMTLHADTFSRLTGKVTDNGGTPVVGAKVTLSRLDRNWTKEVSTNKEGVWLIAGLDAKEYIVTVNAPGFAAYKFKMKAPLGDVLKQDIKLLTVAQNGGAAMVDATGDAPAPQQATAKPQPSVEDPAVKADADAREAFNGAVPFLKANQKDQALPLLKQAYEKITFASDTMAADPMADEQRKADTLSIYPQIARLYGTTLVDCGKKDDAIPILAKVIDLAPGDAANALPIKDLVDIYAEKKDAENKAKYQALLDKLVGPDSSTEYNAGVEAFNTGKMQQAKTHLTKAIQIDPKFPDSYYLLGIVEYALQNPSASKANLKKYLELAPSGKHAQDVKQMLASY
jgi:tetratricopeptide (TPR) repeat protein